MFSVLRTALGPVIAAALLVACGFGPNAQTLNATGVAGARSGTPTTAALLNYLATLPDGRILSGQHTGYWDSDPMAIVRQIPSATGRNVAILGTTLGIVDSREDGVALSNRWLAGGGIVELSLWPDNPLTGVNDNNRSVALSDIYRPGTALNAKWNAYLDRIAAKLKAIHGPVLFRPFVELNGSWSWWGAQPPDQFIALWKYTYNYLMQTRGVDNALWMFNPNRASAATAMAYYPGAAYVDLVSWDSYPPDAGDGPLYAALVAIGKPVILAETGVIRATPQPAVNSGDSSTILATVKANFPRVKAIVVWCQNWALAKQRGETAFMTDPAILTLTDLPTGN